MQLYVNYLFLITFAITPRVWTTFVVEYNMFLIIANNGFKYFAIIFYPSELLGFNYFLPQESQWTTFVVVDYVIANNGFKYFCNYFLPMQSLLITFAVDYDVATTFFAICFN